MIEQDNFGRNLPSAIVKYYNAETAKQAIDNINNKKVMNSVLTVEPYRHKNDQFMHSYKLLINRPRLH